MHAFDDQNSLTMWFTTDRVLIVLSVLFVVALAGTSVAFRRQRLMVLCAHVGSWLWLTG